MSDDSDAKYRGLLEAAPDAMVVVDGAGAIVLLNVQAEKQFGYLRDELVGQAVSQIIPAGFAERLIADELRSAAEALAQHMGSGLELVGRRKDASEFPIELMLSPLESAGEILITAAIRDITKRKSAENQLLQAQKLESIGRLAGGIAHDFNNMLFAIHGHAELLAQDLSSNDPRRTRGGHNLRSVAAITSAAERAAKLTGQLLAFSRQQVVSPKVLDVNARITAIGPMLEQLIGSSVRIVLGLDPTTGHIRADAGQVDQILVNLVVNARDAMPSGGTVRIETGNVRLQAPLSANHTHVEPGSYVVLSVIDTGVGIDPTTREHIFEAFYTTKDLSGGTGLGLATTYGIVGQAGGHISVDSEPGQGAAFKLYFPRVDEAVDEEIEDVVGAVLGHGRILVVDDDAAVREIMVLVLERAGLRRDICGRRLARVGGARRTDPDVMVSDVIMPDMSGVELAARVMKDDPRIGVVLLSGYTAGALNLKRVTGRGAIFVAKPTTAMQLISAVNRALESRRAADQRS
ncbi:MAG: PAS domain S-box protein [Chloroflexi bacterium]|nr:PAS domain S-box protein [Chloroflexota bacterium]